jgi:hypothetical protein
VPAGRVINRVTLCGPLCGRFTAWLSPLLGHATHTPGMASMNLAGARLPLADPFAGELAAQVLFDELQVTPTAALAPLANLFVKLRAAIDPRFALGDKAVIGEGLSRGLDSLETLFGSPPPPTGPAGSPPLTLPLR